MIQFMHNKITIKFQMSKSNTSTDTSNIQVNDEELIQNFDSIDDRIINEVLEFYGFKMDRSVFKKFYIDTIILKCDSKDLRLEFACYCIAYLGKPFGYVIKKFSKNTKVTYQDFKAYWDDWYRLLRDILPIGYKIINENDNEYYIHYEPSIDNIRTLCLKMLKNGLSKSKGKLNETLREAHEDMKTQPIGIQYSLTPPKLRMQLLHYQNEIEDTPAWNKMKMLRVYHQELAEYIIN